MSARGFLGAGDLYIARYNPATAQFDAFKGPYEATKFEIKPNVEIKELSSRGRSTYGQVIESVPLPQPSEFTVDLPEVNRESLSIALLGTDSAINTAAGTITDEAVVAKLDAWIELSKSNFAQAGFAVKNQAGTTTYVLGTDYEVNWRMGWVRVLSGGAIADGAQLKVSGSYNAVTGTQIRGATNAQIRAKFRLDGINFADQLPVIVDVFEAVIAANSAFDFLQNDFASISLPGRLKTPVGKTEPFVVKLLDSAA
ncbi:phage tail tube protein [Cupriavidus necator]